MSFVESKQNRSRPLLAGVFYLALLAWVFFLYAGTAKGLWDAWSIEEYSHGYLLPLISLLWGVRLLQKNPAKPQPSLWGAGLLFLGIALNFAGEIVANNWLSQISMIVSLAGLGGLFFGFSVLKRIAAPLFFLFFAIPLPATVAPALTANMRLISSDLGVAGLQLLGVSVFQEGNIIDLGGLKLQVAEACSGLRYMFPLMSLGYLISFHVFTVAWKRWVLFLFTIPIAIFTNGLRITLTGLVANWFGVESIEGLLHEFEGFVVFVFCLAGVFLVKAVLDRLGRKEDRAELGAILPELKSPVLNGFPRLSGYAAGLSLLVVILSAAGASMLAHPSEQPVLSRQPFAAFPAHIGSWRGESDTLSTSELQALKLTDYLLTRYAKDEMVFPVTFYVAYYASQKQGSSTHSPQICLPGSGWEIVSSERKLINLGSGLVRPFYVNREIIHKGEQKQIVYYWFRESGRDVASNFEIKKQLFLSALHSGRTDGSLIRLTTLISGSQDEQAAEDLFISFMKEAIPLLPAYLPQE